MKEKHRYICNVCHHGVHYPIPYPFIPGTGYLCHTCMRYLSTAAIINTSIQAS